MPTGAYVVSKHPIGSKDKLYTQDAKHGKPAGSGKKMSGSHGGKSKGKMGY